MGHRFWVPLQSGRQVRRVVWGFPALPPPPCCCPLLPLPGYLSWLVVVFCPGVRCYISLLCRLSCCELLSVSFLAGAAPLLRSRWLVLWRCGAGAVGCPLRLLGVCCWVWSPAVVFCWRALAQVLLPGRVAVLCGAALCFVLCSVALCCRVVPCCGALLSGLLCSLVRVVLCSSLAPPVVRCAVLLRVMFCAPVVSPCASLRCRVGAVCCLVLLPVFVGGSGCLVLFSGGVCRPWCPCLDSGRPP